MVAPGPDRQAWVDAVLTEDATTLRSFLRGSRDARSVLDALAALRAGIESERHACLEVFAQMKFDFASQDGNGETALIWAARSGNLSATRWIIDRAAGVLDTQDGEGMTALMHAAARQHLEVVKLLVAVGADTTMNNIYGDSALALARRRRFSVHMPGTGQAGGVFSLPWDSPVAKFLQRRGKSSSQGDV